MDDGTRTHDDRDHNPGLYQLSYAHHYLKSCPASMPHQHLSSSYLPSHTYRAFAARTAHSKSNAHPLCQLRARQDSNLQPPA